MADKAGRRIAQLVAGLDYQPIRAYHGTPHNFDRFDASKIGTGEGAQAYGHGLYFAGNEAVARDYRDRLKGLVDAPVPDALGDELQSVIKEIRRLAKLRSAAKGDEWHALERALAEMHVRHQDVQHRIREASYNPGHMYEVEIGYPEEALLDWDKPVGAEIAGRLDSRMSGDLAAEAQRMADMGQLPRHTQTLSRIASGEVGLAPGEMVYRAAGRFDTPAAKLDLASVHSVPRGWGSVTNTINDSLTNQVKATERLMESGIPGIRYLDQGSRSAGEGTRNYVMFPGTEDRIRILRKYGILAPLALPAMQEDE